jgi:AmiR/NasT family two-component response regulator
MDAHDELAEQVAAWVALAIGNPEAAGWTSEDPNQLCLIMMSRALIEQAKGILRERHKINEDKAFTLLIHASQRTDTKLRDLAAELVSLHAA